MHSTKLTKTVLITGASSGIGRELALILAKNGHNVVLVARREDKLKELAEEIRKKYLVKAYILAADLSDSNAPKHIYNWVQETNLTIDVLVNNAGFGVFGFFWQTDWKEEKDLIQVNITAVIEMIKLFLPGMLERKYGYFLTVGSAAGFQPGPLMPIYYASKAFLLSFSESLANQLSGTGVSSTLLCPGATKTEFAERTGGGETNYSKKNSFFSFPLMSAQTVAEIGYKAMVQKKPIVISGKVNTVLVNLVRFLPRRLVVIIMRKSQEVFR